MTHCQRRPNPRLSLKRCKLLKDWRARVEGVTTQPGWAGAHRDCPLEAMHAAICNALVWLDIDRRRSHG